MRKMNGVVVAAAVLAVSALGLAARPQQASGTSAAPDMKMDMPAPHAAKTNPASSDRSSGATQANAKPVVTIDNFVFSPATLIVAPGTTVTWTNRDDEPHTVTSDEKENKPFASKALDTGETFSFQFTKPGTYGYFCAIHPMMVGKVLVR